MKYLKTFTEPSTWASVAALAQMLSVVLPQYSVVFHAATGVAGALGVALREQTTPRQ